MSGKTGYSWLAALLLAAFLPACSGGGEAQVMALEQSIEKIKSDNRRLEKELTSARREIKSMEESMVQQGLGIARKLSRRYRGRNHVTWVFSSKLLDSVIKRLLENASGSAEGGLSWKLHKIRTRFHRKRIFFHTAFTLEADGGICEGPTSGHLFHQDHEFFGFGEWTISCNLGGRLRELKLSELLPYLPMPIERTKRVPLEVAEGSRLAINAWRYVVPMSVTLEGDQVEVRSRVVGIEVVEED